MRASLSSTNSFLDIFISHVYLAGFAPDE